MNAAGAARNPGRTNFTRGRGFSGLTELNRLLSDRDVLVLELIAAHRFLNTQHVERFLFHDHATSSAGARAARRTLARLEKVRLLDRPIRRVGGLQAGSAASVWMLSNSGQRLLNLRKGLGAVGRVRPPGERFVRHYLAIADTRLNLLTAERNGRLDFGAVEIEPACWRGYLGSGGQPVTLKPDLYAVTSPRDVVTGSAEFEDTWFIEVDRGTESLPVLIRQCQLYEQYRATDAEQHKRGVYPLVVWVVPDERRATNLRAAIDRTRTLHSDLYRVTIPEKFLDLVIGGAA